LECCAFFLFPKKSRKILLYPIEKEQGGMSMKYHARDYLAVLGSHAALLLAVYTWMLAGLPEPEAGAYISCSAVFSVWYA